MTLPDVIRFSWWHLKKARSITLFRLHALNICLYNYPLRINRIPSVCLDPPVSTLGLRWLRHWCPWTFPKRSNQFDQATIFWQMRLQIITTKVRVKEDLISPSLFTNSCSVYPLICERDNQLASRVAGPIRSHCVRWVAWLPLQSGRHTTTGLRYCIRSKLIIGIVQPHRCSYR